MPISKLQTNFLIAPNDNQSTFGSDDKLPNLPLPDIHHTLARYLDSLKPFTTADEFSKSVELVRTFREGVGKALHGKLEVKAGKERNWVEKWWESMAYLQVRLPLIPYCSMDGVFPKNVACWSYGTEEDQIKIKGAQLVNCDKPNLYIKKKCKSPTCIHSMKGGKRIPVIHIDSVSSVTGCCLIIAATHASQFSYYVVQYWTMLRREKVLPTLTSDRKTNFSMSQFRRLFNTTRLPGEKMDSLVCFFKTVSEGFCPATVIVIYKGRLFCLNAVDAKENPISPLQWEKALKEIVKRCNESGGKAELAILTCDTRSNWSKNRKHLENLSHRNKELLELIDKSLFVVVLDDDSPETDSDVTNRNLCGDYVNRWSDKSMSMIFYKNGRSGAICDHTAFDGIVLVSCHNYVLTALEEAQQEDWEKGEIIPFVPEVEELRFVIDETLEREINRLKVETLQNRKEITMTRLIFEDYGKIEIQRLKFHPDSYIQMCLQLAYYNIHRKPAPCYETATTRKFYNGRTETLRCCTTQCLDWVVSMLDPKCTNEERETLFVKAVKRHDELMNEARENAGCDRHLFGMYCAALEEGIEIPDLFFDPAYLKSGGGGNFVLSTSCTGYTPLGGGVAPMCIDGYGVFYNIMPNRVCFTISVNSKSSETDAGNYFSSLKDSLRQTRQMLLTAGLTKSKF